MEEYALNTFSDVWHKDPARLLDLGNDVQLLHDKITGNKTGETDRAERNILHAMGEPYKPGEIFFNVLTNIAPTALAFLIGANSGAHLNKILKLTRAYKPYALVPSKWGMTTKQALKMAASTIADTMAKDSAESVGKTLGKAALKEAAMTSFYAPYIKGAGYTKSRHAADRGTMWKSVVLSMLNADMEDPARFNEDDVKLAFETIFGPDELSIALNEEHITPRQMISEIRAVIKDNPDKAAKFREDFIKAKMAHNAEKE